MYAIRSYYEGKGNTEHHGMAPGYDPCGACVEDIVLLGQRHHLGGILWKVFNEGDGA